MTQLTIRSQSKELDAKLKALARERGWSLNQAANYLLQKGAGLLDAPASTGVADDLDRFIGSWSDSEAEAFDRRVAAATETIDEELWK
jgi:hypothetical protein